MLLAEPIHGEASPLFFFLRLNYFFYFFQLNRRVGATTALAELENREACPRPWDITGDEKLI
jgi:hypothetical protein